MRGRALFLCYPPPDSSMAEVALRAYTGDTVGCVGEWSGDTGTAAFQQALLCDWRLVEAVPLPNWGDTCYELLVWRRKSAKQMLAGKRVRCQHGAAAAKDERAGAAADCTRLDGSVREAVEPPAGDDRPSRLEPLATSCHQCGSAGAEDAPLRRCRLTCCFAFCSQRCLNAAIAAPRHTASSQDRGKREAGARLLPYRRELATRQCGVDPVALRLSDDRVYRDARGQEAATAAHLPGTQRKRVKRKRR